MKKSRLFEFLLVFLGVAFVVSLLADKQGEKVPETPANTPATNRPLDIGDAVPTFSLQDKDRQQVTYTQGQGPILVVLTATGCRECLERISSEDVEARLLANSQKVEVWNLLVFQRPEGVAGFVEQRNPSADKVLADPSSEISVRMLGGSDQTCWLLIDGEGKLAYRGPVDLDALETAMSKLS